MFKIILNLILTGASKEQWRLRIGSHLLKKGCGYKVGQIVETKRLRDNLYRCRIITGIFYDFKENKVNHTSEKRVLKAHEIKQ